MHLSLTPDFPHTQGSVLLRIARTRPSPFNLGQPNARHGYKFKLKALNPHISSLQMPSPDARTHGLQRSFNRQQVS
jgi:hypothetical protein